MARRFNGASRTSVYGTKRDAVFELWRILRYRYNHSQGALLYWLQ